MQEVVARFWSLFFALQSSDLAHRKLQRQQYHRRLCHFGAKSFWVAYPACRFALRKGCVQVALSGRGLSFLAFCCGFAPLAVGNRIINRFFRKKSDLDYSKSKGLNAEMMCSICMGEASFATIDTTSKRASLSMLCLTR